VRSALHIDTRLPLIASAPREGIEVGTYHLTAMGQPSWHEFAQIVLAEAVDLGRSCASGPTMSQPFEPTPTHAGPWPANSRLATDKLRNTFRVSLPDWRERVTVVREIVVPQLP
jgi:dTDP-4-dehydrorhamnose reductase